MNMTFLSRLKEPSSWAGIAVLAQLAASTLDLHGDVGGATTQVLSAVAAVAAVVRAEQKASAAK
jgi:hypothetical protein